MGFTLFLIANLLLLQAGVSSSFLTASTTRRSGANPKIVSSWWRSSSSHRRHGTKMNMADNENSSEESSPSLNMSDLRKRMERQESQYAKLVEEQFNYASEAEGRVVPESVHIILFHPGTEKQHVHTIEFPKDSGNNMILAFESGGDCVNFARLLRDLEFVDPSPEQTIFEPFRQFCEMSGLSLMIVPKGFELTPPQLNANDDGDGDDDEVDLVDNDIAIVNDMMASSDGSDDDYDDDAWG